MNKELSCGGSMRRRHLLTLALLMCLVFVVFTPVRMAATAQVDPGAEVAAALYYASATETAAKKYSNAKLLALEAQIVDLRARLRAGDGRLLSRLKAAQEDYVASLTAIDRTYAQEIAVFRATVADIAATPAGASALARFNAGNEDEALEILDDLRSARDAARRKRSDIESALEGRRIANLALEARARGKQKTAQVIKRFEDVTRLDPGVHWDWIELSRLYRDAGRLGNALKAANQSAATAENSKDRSSALNQKGIVQIAQGRLPDALQSYNDAFAILVNLSKREPRDAEVQQRLSVAHENIGDVLVLQGNFATALTNYREAARIRRNLALDYPNNAELMRGLTIAYNKAGDALVKLSRGEEALATYRDAIEIRTRQAERDRENLLWQRDLSVSYMKIGNLVAKRDRSEALDNYKAALQIRERLVAIDGENWEWQRDLSRTLERLGNLLLDAGKGADALEKYRSSLSISDSLAKKDPANELWQRDLSIANEKIGDVLLANGDRHEALTKYWEALTITERLAEKDPSNAEWQLDLVVSLVKLNDVTGDKMYADRAYSIALAMQQRGILSPQDLGKIPDLKRRAGL